MMAVQPQRSALPQKIVKPLRAAMVPLSATDIAGPRYLRMLVLGWQKIGKSCAVISTAPGKVYVINTDQPTSLEPVLDFRQDFLHNHVRSSLEMNDALALATQLVRDGEVQSVVWDTMSGYSPIVEAEAFAATLTSNGNEDGRTASPLYRKIMRATVKRLFNLKCHVIVISHYLDSGGQSDDAGKGEDGKPVKRVAKQGPGIVPMLYGAFRAEVGTMFDDVVFMEKQMVGPNDEARFFITGMNGVFGPGCRSMTGNHALPADVSNFLKLAEAKNVERRTKASMGSKVAMKASTSTSIRNGASK
jgi:AAA domain